MIWCVDDDNTIREIEVYTLMSTGFQAKGFADGEALFAALETETPDLIVLDIMLPGDDGVEILRRLRSHAKYKDIAVIMATAKGTETDKIQGLNFGADDYLVKPFGMMEMVARINAVLRRTGRHHGNDTLCVGHILLKRKEHEVFVDGAKIELTHKEFAILRLFMKHPGVVYSRDHLMNEVWGTDYAGESRTVDVHIKTLRHKLGDAGAQIKTVIGVGYRLEGET